MNSKWEQELGEKKNTNHFKDDDCSELNDNDLCSVVVVVEKNLMECINQRFNANLQASGNIKITIFYSVLHMWLGYSWNCIG